MTDELLLREDMAIVNFKAEDYYSITGRGVVFTGKNPFEDGVNPLGRVIDVDDLGLYQINGVERMGGRPIRKGELIGFLVKVISDPVSIVK